MLVSVVVASAGGVLVSWGGLFSSAMAGEGEVSAVGLVWFAWLYAWLSELGR